MKILFQNRPKQLWQGGDFFQLEATADALRKRGHEVTISGELIYVPALDYRKFDIIHTFNFSMPWTPYQLKLGYMYHKPTVCSMIYHDREDFVPFTEQQYIIDKLDKAIFLNEGEIERCRKKLDVKDEQIEIIPNGIDEFWFSEVDRDINSKPYVLTVGRIEPHKGQLAVAKVCQKLGLMYIMAGQAVKEGYLEMCKAHGAIHQEPLPREELISLYRNCACFFLNSKAEVQPLTVMEAGAQECNIVLSKGSLWKPNNVQMIDCDDKEQIEEAIKKAIELPPNKEIREEVRFSWDDVAEKLERIYKELVSNPRAMFTWKL